MQGTPAIRFEPEKLRHDVEPEVKQAVEHAQPAIHVGQSQLEDALHDAEPVHLRERAFVAADKESDEEADEIQPITPS